MQGLNSPIGLSIALPLAMYLLCAAQVLDSAAEGELLLVVAEWQFSGSDTLLSATTATPTMHTTKKVRLVPAEPVQVREGRFKELIWVHLRLMACSQEENLSSARATE